MAAAAVAVMYCLLFGRLLEVSVTPFGARRQDYCIHAENRRAETECRAPAPGRPK